MRLFRKRVLSKRSDELRVFYCSDVHGSDVCFRKFVNAGEHYGADVLILGGDLTGKAVVPIVQEADGTWWAQIHGERREAYSDADVAALRHVIESNGFYSLDVTPEELQRLRSSPDAVSDCFRARTIEQMQEWIALADERLDGTGRTCVVMPGNDDEYYLDEALGRGRIARNGDGVVVTLSNGVEVASLSSSNVTPWNSPREFSEEILSQQVAELHGRLRNPPRAILNIHVPPHGTGLDTVQKLDDDLRPVFDRGTPVQVPCGSTAVRKAIEEFQPLLSVHGHVHECRAATKLGRSLCINPGSDYPSGALHGVLVDLTPSEVIRHEFTEG